MDHVWPVLMLKATHDGHDDHDRVKPQPMDRVGDDEK
jgi:hypothetical protein